MKLVLIGYMASGKSFIAKELASRIGVKHLDLDNYIEEKEDIKINELFKNKGEIKFRLFENNYLLELLLSEKEFILSVGGGTPCYSNNMDLILKHSKSIYLKATTETLYNRLINEKEQRPLVSDIKDDNLKEFIAKHLFERNFFYNKANITINVDGKSLEEIIEEIISLS